MKKRRTSKAIAWWRNSVLQGLVIFAVLAVGFTAYGAIDWPEGQAPNPVTGVVGMFVGDSGNSFDSPIDYQTANGYCEAAHAGSHVCTPDEMINSYNHASNEAPVLEYATEVTLWINNGPPGYSANANDCLGWTVVVPGSGGNPNFGTVWNFESDQGILKRCGTGRPFACCM
jgi:hypothetical protein